MFRKETRLGPAQRRAWGRKGVVLVIVVVVAIIFAIIGFGVLGLAQHEITLTRIETDKAKAFYIAESGLAKLSEMLQQPVVGELDDIIGDALEEQTLEQGSFSVELDTSQTHAISTGTSGTAQRKIRVQLNFLAAPFEHAIFAMNASGGAWGLQLRGRGDPDRNDRGGRDIIRGNIFVDGDTFLYEQSSVNPAPAPNKWNLNGDVGATGNISVDEASGASVSGAVNPRAAEPPEVALKTMNYAVNNTDNVAQIFQDARVSSGYLPSGNPLRDVFVKNPSDRSAECGSTIGRDDYFLEPSTGVIAGTEKTGQTPLHAGAGADRVYYVDGDVWVHNKITYGFKMDGKVTIVATGDIHICDNIEYKDKAKDLLGLVALGKYDGSGTLTSGGNIFFGDPRYGTMYTIAGLMFAANDFLYNTYPVDRTNAEPTSGFIVNGSFAAMNQVVVERDWYTKSGKARPARYDSTTSRWVDCATGTALTSAEFGSLRHYQMIVNYDDRVRDQATRPPGLPRGRQGIFAGFSNWEEL